MASNGDDIVPLIGQQDQDIYPEFNYDAINFPEKSSEKVYSTQAQYDDATFISTADGALFFVFLKMEEPPENIAANIFPERNFGWKFHVSIDDSDEENIARGWNLVKDILIRERVHTSKVVKKGCQMVETKVVERGLQRGKQITIYTAQHSDRDLESWARLVNDITRVLAEKGIKPSHRPESDESIEGSNYVSFRSDGYYDDEKYQNVPFNDTEDWRDQMEVFYPEKLHGLKEFKKAIKIDPSIPNQPDNLIWTPSPTCCPF